MKQGLIGPETQQVKYEEFVNTQLALLRGSTVIGKALEVADVAQLTCVKKQKDRKAWLTKKLRVKPEGKSEIIGISIETDSEEASEKIVNAVVHQYFSLIENNSKTNESSMQLQLQAEKTRHATRAQSLQKEIRDATQIAASKGAIGSNDGGMSPGLGQGESLRRDVLVESSKLIVLQANLKGLKDRIQNPQEIPMSVLMHTSPAIRKLSEEREYWTQERSKTAQNLLEPDKNPKVIVIDREINRIDKEFASLVGDADGSAMKQLLSDLRTQAEFDMYQVMQDIKQQEILVDELTKKFEEQLKDSQDRSANVLEASFAQVKLIQTNKIIDQIEERLLAITTESRAPNQILLLTEAVSSKPVVTKQLMIVGAGSLMFSFFPLLLSIAVERLKPRLYHVSQVRRSIPQVLIGEIMEPPVSWIHGAHFRKRLARYRESVHNWCTHLLLSDPFRTCRTLSIASVAGDDGKTFLAVQIAVAMAQMKANEVLLIDGDMRVGRLHLLFGNEEAGIGLADVLAGDHKFGKAWVMNEKEPNLHLLSAGQLNMNPYELLGDGRFREFLDMLEQKYSLVIVVLPPIANAAESLIMAQATDSTLLCVRQGETVLAAMEDVYRKLVNTGASVDGIVVKDIPYYQMAGRDGGFADKLEQIRLSHLLQYAD
jgi:capsular exopolysaccharide synthesis family protein